MPCLKRRLILKAPLIIQFLFRILFYRCIHIYTIKKIKIILILAIMCFVVFLFIQSSARFQRENMKNSCILQDINFYDKSLEDIFRKYQIRDCAEWGDIVYFENNGVLRMNNTEIIRNKHSNLTCGYSDIYLLDHNTISFSPPTEKYRYLPLPSRTDSEVVHVRCRNLEGKVVYSNLNYKIIRNEEKMRKLRNESQNQLSIIILGLDSVSRLVAERMLPKTMSYMRDELGAYVMKGYTKVGDNTFPNVVAMMTGKTLLEAALQLQYPTLYKDVLNNGYIDCQSEDYDADLPYQLLRIPYYTHYLRKLFLASTKIKMLMTEHSRHVTQFTDESSTCFGNKKKHKVVLGYTKKCIEAYGQKLKFVYMWQNALGHGDSNRLQYADKDLKQFLQWLNETDRLQNAVVLLCADHGPRHGPVPKTDIGRFTGRLPLLSVLVPEQLKKRFPHLHQNLLLNTERLTTPFDFHETLSDIVHRNFEPKKINHRSGNMPRGISLFQEIPKERTCFDAGISEHYCACYSYSNVSVETQAVLEVSRFVVHTINEFLLKEKDNCATLQLSKIISAKIQYAPRSESEQEVSTNYVVLLETVPGQALFEATAQYYSNVRINMLGDINRINTYGNQSSCIKDTFLHLYCFCNMYWQPV